MTKFLQLKNSFLRVLIASVFLTATFQLSAQIENEFVWNNTSVNIDKCFGSKTFIISVKNNRSNQQNYSNVTIVPTFPTGVTVKAGTLVDLTNSFTPNQNLSPAFTSGGISWDGTKFTITNTWSYLGTIRFSFELEAACSANDVNYLSNTYVLRSGGVNIATMSDGTQQGTTSPYSVLGADLSITTAPTNNNLSNVLVNQVFNQVVTVTNGGKGKVKNLELDLDAQSTNSTNTPTISNPKVYANGTTTPIGTAALKSDGKTLAITLDSVFYDNMKIDIAYDFKVKNCNSTNRGIMAKAMCGNTVCKTSNTVNSVYTVNTTRTTMTTTMAELSVLSNADQIIGGARKIKYTVKNTGTNISKVGAFAIYDGGNYPFPRWGSYTPNPAGTFEVIQSSIVILNSAGDTLRSNSYSTAPNWTNHLSSAQGACFFNKPQGYTISLNNYYLQPGEQLTVYYEIRQCDSDVNAPKVVPSQNSDYDLASGSIVLISNKYYYSWWYGINMLWYDQCGTGIDLYSNPSNIIMYNVSSRIGSTIAPAQVLGAKKFYIEGETEMNSWINFHGTANLPKIFQMDIKLPNGVTYVPNTYFSSTSNTLISGYPQFNNSTKTLSLRFYDSGNAAKKISYKLQLETDGVSSCGKQPIIHQTYVVGNSNGTKPLVSQTMKVDTVDFQCDLTCTGIIPISAVVERSNFGMPDNNEDGYPEANGTLDRSKIALYHLRYGDKVKATTKSAICGTYSRFQTDQRFGEGKWKPVGFPTINLIRGSTGQKSTVPGNITQIGTTQRDFIIQWSGNEPAGWGDYQDLDSIEVIQEYELAQNVFYDSNNNWLGVKTALFSSTTYISTGNTLSNDWTYNGPLKRASFTALQNLYLVSGFDLNYLYTQWDNLYTLSGYNNVVNNGCSLMTYGVFMSPSKIGYTFPYEYRPLLRPEEFKITIPTGMMFNGFTSLKLGYSSWATNVSLMSPYTTISGSEVTVNLKGLLDSKPAEYVGEYSDIRINFGLLPKERCFNVNGLLGMTIKQKMLDKSIPNATTDSTIVVNINPQITSSLNTLTTFFSTSKNQELINGVSTNKFTIKNTSSNLVSNNSWFYIRSRKAYSSISNVKIGGVAVTSNSNGVYLLGTLAANTSSSEISFDATLNLSCAKDTIDVYFGSECSASGIPTDVLNYTCKSSDYIVQSAVNSNFSGNVLNINEGLGATFCSSFTVEFEVRNTNIGFIKDVKTSIFSAPGIYYVPGSVKFKFPGSSSNWVSSSYNPTIVQNDPTGFNILFNITNPSSGVGSGILNQLFLEGTTNTNANTIKVQYTVESKCGSSEGFPIYHNFYASKVCGDQLPTIYQASQNLAFQNLAGPNYSTNISKSSVDPAIKNCTTGNKLRVKVINLGPNATGPNELIRVLLPETVTFANYDPSASGQINAPSTQPVMQEYGVHVLNWPMPENIAAGDSIQFDVFMKPNLNAFLPTTGQITILTGKMITSTCNGDTCDVFKTTGSQNININVSAGPSTPYAVVTNPTCTNGLGAISFVDPIQTGNVYSIDGGQNYNSSYIFSSLNPGSYSLKVKNDQGCISPATVNKTVNTQPPSPATPTISGGDGSYCEGQSFVLTSSSSTNNQWYRNGAAISGATNATYTVTTAGTYKVIISNSFGCTATSADKVITFTALPAKPTISGGTSTNGYYCPGTSVVLTSSTGLAYQWYKNGEAISGATNSTYTVTSAGTYTVKLLNGVCEGPSSSNKVINYYTAPSAPTLSGGDLSPYCSNQTVILQSTGSNNQWYKDGVAISGANAATYSVTQTGTYTVVVSNSYGCTTNSANSKDVEIKPAPNTPTISKDIFAPYCTGDILTFTSSSASNNQWYKNGSAIAGETNQTLSVSSTGIYLVKVTGSNGCVSDPSASQNITFNSRPAKPEISGSIEGTYCENQTISISSSTAVSYQWYKNGVPIPGANAQNYEVTQTGTYTVIVKNTEGCESEASLSKSYTVYQRPSKPDIIGNSTTVCQGTTVNLSTSASGVTYQWYKDGTSITNETNSLLPVTTTGTYHVVVTNTDGCSSLSSDTRNIVVNANPSTPMITGYDDTVTHCSGETIVLESSSSSGNQWYKNGSAIAGATNQTFSVTQTGSYTVEVSNSNSCSSGASTATDVLIKNTVATPIISAVGTHCEGTTTTLKSNKTGAHQWFLNGTAIPGISADSLLVSQAGSYTVKTFETSTNCASDQSDSIVVHFNPAATLSHNTTLYPGVNIDLCAPSSTTKTSASIHTAVEENGVSKGLSNYNYSWKKGNVVIANQTLDSLVISNVVGSDPSGTYTVTVTDKVTGCFATSTSQLVTVFTEPTRQILSSNVALNDTICVNSTIAIKASNITAAAPYQIKWYDAYDGTYLNDTTSTINRQDSHGHWIAGVQKSIYQYQYFVTDVNSCSYPSNIYQFYEGAVPLKPTISGGEAGAFCDGETVILVSSNRFGNQWYKNGTVIAGETNDSLLVTTSGEYQVIINQYNCSSPLSEKSILTFNTKPNAPTIGGSVAGTYCADTQIWLTSNYTTGNQWYKNGTAIFGETNDSLLVTTSGSYTVQHVSSLNCYSNQSVAHVITVNPLPARPHLVVSNSSICEGASTTLVSDYTGTNKWFKDAIEIANETNDSLVATSAGTYTVSAVDQNGCISQKSSGQAIVVKRNPIAEIVEGSLVGIVPDGNCQKIATDLTAKAQTVSGVPTYVWQRSSSVSGPYSSTGTSLSQVSVLTSGFYKLKVDLNGCSTTSAVTQVVDFPTYTIEKYQICAGDSTKLEVSGSLSTVDSYQWYKDDQLINGATQAVYYAKEGGAYTAHTFYNNFEQSTCSITIVKNTPSTVSIVSTPNVSSICFGDQVKFKSNPSRTSASGLQFKWFKNDVEIVGQTTDSLLVSDGGQYKVKLTDANGCSSLSAVKNLVLNNPPVTPEGYVTAQPTCSSAYGEFKISTPLGSQYSYSIDGIIYQSSITFVVGPSQSGDTLFVKNTNGCIQTGTIPVINAQPQTPAKPTISGTAAGSYCQGASIILVSSSTTGNQWFVNNVAISNATNDSLVVSSSGSYSVQVTSDTNCQSEMSNAVVITVLAKPVAPIISGSSAGDYCAGSKIVLRSNKTTGNQWYKDGAVISGATSDSLLVTSAGLYTAKYTATNGCESNSSSGTLFSILPKPSTPVVSNQSGTYCAGTQKVLRSSASTGNQWYKNGQLLVGETKDSLLVSSAGRYVVLVTGTNGCVSDSSNANEIGYFATPAAAIVSGSTAGNYCVGDVIRLVSSVAQGNQWFKDGQEIVGATNDTLMVTQTGNYTVSYQDNNGCWSSSSAGKSIQVNVKPAQPSIVRNGTSTFCEGERTVLKSSQSTGNQWYKNGALLVGAILDSLVVTESGNYTLVVENAFHCQSVPSSQEAITVKPLPLAEITQGLSLAFSQGNNCQINPIDLTAKPQSIAGTPTYEWSYKAVETDPLNSLNNTTDHYSAMVQGYYQVKVTLDGCAKSSTFTRIYQPPTLNVTQTLICLGDTATLSVTSTGGLLNPSYQWYRNDTLVVGATSDVIKTILPGQYYVQLTESGSSIELNSCPADVILKAQSRVSLTYTRNGVICAGKEETIIAHARVNGPFTFEWYKNGILTNVQDSVFVTTLSGDYHAKVINNDGCAIRSEVHTVTVNSLPTNPSIEIVSQPTCTSANAIVRVNAPLGTNLSYSTDSLTNYQASRVFNLPATYTNTKLYVKDTNGCISSGLIPLITNQPPSPTNPQAVRDTLQNNCGEILVNLTSLQPAASTGIQYEWWTGSTSVRGTLITNPQQYAGSGKVYLWAKNTSGCYSAKGDSVRVIQISCCPDDPGVFERIPSIYYGPATIRFAYTVGTYENPRFVLVNQLDGKIKQVLTNSDDPFTNVASGNYRVYALVYHPSISPTGIVEGALFDNVRPTCSDVAFIDIAVNPYCDYESTWNYGGLEGNTTKNGTYAMVDTYDGNKIVAIDANGRFDYQMGVGYQLVKILYTSGLQNFQIGNRLNQVTATGLELEAGQLVKHCEAVTLQFDGQLFLDQNKNNLLDLDLPEDERNLPSGTKYVKLYDRTNKVVISVSEVGSRQYFSFSADLPDGKYAIFLDDNDLSYDTTSTMATYWSCQYIPFRIEFGQIVEQEIFQGGNTIPLAMQSNVPRPQPVDPTKEVLGTYTQKYCLGDTNNLIAVQPANGGVLKWYTQQTGGTALSTSPSANTSQAGTSTYYVSQIINEGESDRLKVVLEVNNKPSTPGSIIGKTMALIGSYEVYRISPRNSSGTYVWTLPTGWSSNNSTADTIRVLVGTRAGGISVKQVNSSGCTSEACLLQLRTTQDSDGDGVTDAQEALDQTNPNDGCSYKPSSVTLPQSNAWKALDCDGDGTDNEHDIDPLNFCVGGIVGYIPSLNSPQYNQYFKDGDCDGDGISNHMETNLSGLPLDTDFDGVPNYLDLDSDNDNIPDAVEGNRHMDSDNIANYEDLDSDNDGISDKEEGVEDTDHDGIPNYLDVDSDGDRILDAWEALPIFVPNRDDNYDGQVDKNGVFIDKNGNGWADISEGQLATDTDRDGNSDYKDLDSDNDCIPDKVELTDDTDNDGIQNYRDSDSDGDHIPDYVEAVNCSQPIDTDADGTPDYLDLDSDSDCIPDVKEAGKNPSQPIDTDKDGIPDYRDMDSDNDCIPDKKEIGTDCGNPIDSDGDGIPDYLDLDADNDCIPDSIEVGKDCGNPIDTDGDGIPDYLDTDSDGDCIPDSIEVGSICGTPLDTDKDGIPNYLDRDSDNDCIPDKVEVGKDCGVPVDTDKDGTPDYLDTDSDGDCIPDQLEAGTDCSNPVDTDKDGLPDYRDTDADNDCIPDTIEVGKVCGSPVDTDKDGIPDFKDSDSDGDCIPDSIEVGKVCGVPVDSDKDGNPDYLDLDSDNDCIPDSIEVGICGTPLDSDGDGKPNYLDDDSDGDCIPDSIEVGAICGKPIDTDKDGIADFLDLDSDGDCISDKIEGGDVCGKVVDTDKDGTPDYLDLDSDNDSYSDHEEAGADCSNPADTDKDKVYDFRDLDSDGDGIPDKDEDDIDFGGLPDCDHDGVSNRIDPDFCDWFLPNGISPNQDGANDRLIIPGIRRLPQNRIAIYNRWGSLVFEQENYKNDWGGEFNVGNPLIDIDGKLPDGTYYYVIDFYGKYATRATYVYINRLLK